MTNLVHLGEFVLEFLSVICVFIGLIQSLKLVITSKRQRQNFSLFLEFRLNFGLWLSLALELQLGADILGTTIAPNWESLAKLATLAVIRTFLNYFLNQELEQKQEIKEKNLKNQSENE